MSGDAGAGSGAAARAAAALLAAGGHAIGGALLRAPGTEELARWTAAVRERLPAGEAWRRIPLGVTDDRLVGGLDLAATLATGRPVGERGLLAECDGGVAVLPCAERAGAGVVAALCAVLDDGIVRVERDGLTRRDPARTALIAIDESSPDEQPVRGALADRLALHVVIPAGFDADAMPTADAIARARASAPSVSLGDDGIVALCETAASFGVHSARAPILAARVARLHAALAGRAVVSEEDLTAAARLVLAPRATVLPAAPEEPATPEPPPPPRSPDPPRASDDASPAPPDADTPLDDRDLAELLVAATRAALPADLLESLARGAARAQEGGRAGGATKEALRGRALGVRAGEPRGGRRLHVLETLRAAAPWQRARGARPARVEVRRTDFRIRRFVEPSSSTIIFAVDASGSSALHRLGEAKGAVELLLAESYARRDRVALIAFRGSKADVVLPPTRALALARRRLAGVVGGGGTPLAMAIDVASEQALAARRAGSSPLVVLLTDARANVARDGSQAAGRAKAQEDAMSAARALRARTIPVLLLDTAPRPEAFARRLADALGARYVPLPHADARQVSAAVRAAGGLDGRPG